MIRKKKETVQKGIKNGMKNTQKQRKNRVKMAKSTPTVSTQKHGNPLIPRVPAFFICVRDTFLIRIILNCLF